MNKDEHLDENKHKRKLSYLSDFRDDKKGTSENKSYEERYNSVNGKYTHNNADHFESRNHNHKYNKNRVYRHEMGHRKEYYDPRDENKCRSITEKKNTVEYYRRKSNSRSRSNSNPKPKNVEICRYSSKRTSADDRYQYNIHNKNCSIIDKVKKDLEYSNRDDLTVLVLNLHSSALEYDVYEFFTSHAGNVRDIRIIRDNRSGRSKGVCYVEFYRIESVLKALKLSGQKIMNSPITVQASQAEKNRAAKLAKIEEIKAETTPLILKVTGLVDVLSKINEDELMDLFSIFGGISKVEIKRDLDSDEHLGYAFVEFEKAIQGQDAISALNDFEIAGKRIFVEIFNENCDTKSYKNNSKRTSSVNYSNLVMIERTRGGGQQAALDKNELNKQTLTKTGLSNYTKVNPGEKSDKMNNNWNNDSDNGECHKKASIELYEAENAGNSPVEPSMNDGNKVSEDSNTMPNEPTVCLLMSNLFTKESLMESIIENEIEYGERLTEEQTLDEILRDVEEECSKYGKIVRCFMEKDLSKIDGNVWIQYENINESKNARKIFDGRYFGGRQISVKYISECEFPS